MIATRGWLEPFGTPVLGLGPLGVRPDRQRGGVGTALVHAVLAVAEAADERLVALAGLARLLTGGSGSSPAAELGITAPDPAWGVHFQARLLNGPPVAGRLPVRGAVQPPVNGVPRRGKRLPWHSARGPSGGGPWRWLTVICLPPGSGPPGTGIHGCRRARSSGGPGR